MTDSPACFRCGSDMEDALHTIRVCPSSKEVWMKTGLTYLVPNFFLLSLNDWILNCISFCRSTRGGRWMAGEDDHHDVVPMEMKKQ